MKRKSILKFFTIVAIVTITLLYGSANIVFAEGEVLNMDFSEYFGEPGFKMLVSLDESQIGSTVEIDIYEVEEDIIEFVHYPKKGEEVEVTVI